MDQHRHCQTTGTGFLSWYLLSNQTQKMAGEDCSLVKKNCRHPKDLSALFKYSIKKEKHFIWCSIKFTLNNESRLSISRESPRFKDVLSVRLRTKLPAGHSMHLLASEEALTNHPSEHGSNLYLPRLWLANPDCLKAGSSWSLIQDHSVKEETSIYSESSCPTPLKWKIRKKKTK